MFEKQHPQLQTLVQAQFETDSAGSEFPLVEDGAAPAMSESVQTPQHRVNVKLLAITIVLLVIIVPAVRIWHARQKQSMAGALLERADAAESWQDKVDCLQRYVGLFPTDLETLERLARLLDSNARTQHDKSRALAAFRRCVAKCPDRWDLRIRHGELLLQNGMAFEALHEAGSVLGHVQEHPGAIELRANAFDVLLRNGHNWQIPNAIAAYEQWLASDPGNVDVSSRLANLYYSHLSGVPDDDEEFIARADDIINQMVANSPNNVDARLARFYFRLRHHSQRLNRSLDPDVGLALEIEPQNPRVLLCAALCYLTPNASEFHAVPQQDLQTAQRFLRTAIQTGEAEADVFEMMAKVSFALNSIQLAEQAIRDGIRKYPKNTDLRLSLAKIQMQRGFWTDAKAAIDDLGARLRRTSETSPEVRDNQRFRAIQLHVLALQSRWHLAPENPAGQQATAKRIASLFETRDISWKDSPSLWSDVVATLAQLGHWKLALRIFDKAKNTPDHPLTPRLYIAEALRRAGKSKDAMKHLQIILFRDPSRQLRVQALSLLCQTMLEYESQKPMRMRVWRDFDRAFADLKALEPDAAETVFLEADHQLARIGQPATGDVIRLIEEAAVQHANDMSFWERAIAIFIRIDAAEELAKAIDQLRNLDSEAVSDLAAQLASVRARNDEHIDDTELEAASSLDTTTDFMRSVTTTMRNGEYDEAFEMLWNWSRRKPDAFRPRMMLMDAAISMRRLDDLRRVEAELNELEGEHKFFSMYATIRRLILEAELGAPGTLFEADQLCAEWVRQQPTSQFARSTAAIVAQAQGDLSDAIKHYEYIYDNKDRSIRTSQTLVGFLLLEGNNKRASEHIDALTEEDVLHPSILPLAAEAKIRTGAAEDALQLVERGLQRDPNAPRLHMMRGRALLSQRDNANYESARDALLRAVRLQPDNFSSWIALLHHDVARPDGPHTRDLAVTLRSILALTTAHGRAIPDAWQLLAVATCLELTGDLREAEIYYRKALHATGKTDARRWIPDGVVITDGFLRGDEFQLSSTLIWSLDLHVRQTLGLILCCTSPDPEPYQLYLEENPRLHAIVALYQSDDSASSTALHWLREIPSENRSVADYLLVAEIHRRAGDKAQAMAAYESAAALGTSTAEKREIVEYALRYGNWDLAANCINQMESSDKTEETLDLRLKLLIGQGFAEQAVQLSLEKMKNIPSTEAQGLLQLAISTLASLNHHDTARNLLEQATQESDEQPVFMELLTPMELDRTIDLCVHVAESRNLQQGVALAMSCAERHSLSPDATQRVEKLIDKMLEEDSVPPEFYSSLARLREKQGRLDQAVKWTEKALSDSPGHPLHVNNLAWYEATYHGEYERSLDRINDLIRRFGPIDFALDTKAIILIGAGNHSVAVQLLEGIAAPVDAPPETLLHLAAAFHRAGRLDECRQTWKQAQERLRIGNLVPFDKDLVNRLSAVDFSD